MPRLSTGSGLAHQAGAGNGALRRDRYQHVSGLPE